jgi:hypothetical protein
MKKDQDIENTSATFLCGACGQEASRVTLVPPGQPDPRLSPETPDMPKGISMILSEYPILSISGGPVGVSMPVAENLIERIKDALLTHNAARLYDIDNEYAPFWCPMCSCCYCGTHYVTETVYDDGFFDCIRGICPKGHKRTLAD